MAVESSPIYGREGGQFKNGQAHFAQVRIALSAGCAPARLRMSYLHSLEARCSSSYAYMNKSVCSAHVRLENLEEIFDFFDVTFVMAESGFFHQPDAERKLALEVEGKKFWVSREMISLYSPLFKNMLYGNLAEAKSDTIKFPDKQADVIEELLFCLFPTPEVKKISYDNLELLLLLADEYQIRDIHSRADDFLRHQLAICGKGDEKLLFLVRVSAKFRLKESLVMSVKRCAEEFAFRKLDPLIPELPAEVAAALLHAHKATATEMLSVSVDKLFYEMHLQR